MTSNKLITTYNIRTEKIKTFIFNNCKIEDPEIAAKKFCKENNMKFLGCKIVKPYTIHTWQHYDAITFDAECTSKTPLWYYEYGKL